MAKEKDKKPFNVLSKKGFVTMALAGVMVASPFMLTGCGEAGPKGDAGNNGKSAYELAVEAGFTGTLQEWLASLQGGGGATGATGNGIVSIEKTGTNGLVDTYTITFTDGTTKTFDITNGSQGPQGTTGATGPQGPTGETGPQGPAGEDGADFGEAISSWKGKSAVFVGDSITAGAGITKKYWQLLDDYLQLGTVTDMGIGGSCISVTSNYGTQYNPLATRYNSIPQADLIQIFMGTNDYGHDTPLGTIDDASDISFYGALNVIIKGLQTKYPTSRIVFVTPLHRYGANGLTYDYTQNGAGKTLKDYVDAIKQTCERYSVPVIDLFNISGINPAIPDMKSTYMPDGIHPNDAGHELIANLMQNYLELFATNQPLSKGDGGQETPTPGEGGGTENPEEPDDGGEALEWETIGFEKGNLFGASSGNAQANRMSSLKNIYLTKDQTISILNNSTYKYFLYPQTGYDRTQVSASNLTAVMDQWATGPYVAVTSGWYGVVIAKNDDTDFDNTTISNSKLSDFFSLSADTLENDNISNFTMVLGHQYVETGPSLTTRSSLNKNIFLKAGTTISLVNTEGYKFAVYTQIDENYDFYTQSNSLQILTDGYQKTSVTVAETGYYGIVLVKETEADFNFNSDSNQASNYLSIS